MGLRELACAGREISADNGFHHLDGGFAQRRGVKPFHDLEMEVAGVRLRLKLRADDDVD